MDAHIVLLGFSGTGKSVVGKALADALHCPCYDLDATIEADHQCSIAEIFAQKGEAHFRVLESDYLLRTLLRPKGVIVPGAGIVMAAENRRQLGAARTHMICLDASLTTVQKRLQNDARSARPLSKNGDFAAVQQLWQVREPFYRAVPVHVETDNRSVDEVVATICGLIELPSTKARAVTAS